MSADDRDRGGPGDLDHAQAVNPHADPFLLARIAEERPDLHAALAGNPACPVHVLQWLRSLRNPAIEQALQHNPTALTMGVVKAAAPLAPDADAARWTAPAPTERLESPAWAPTVPVAPVGPPEPPTVVMPVAAATPSPTVVLPTTRAVPADPTPTVIARPPAPPIEDEPRTRGFGLLLVLIPLLFVGGCLAAVAMARRGDDKPQGASGASTTRSAALPTQPTAASTPTTGRAPATEVATAPTTPSTPAVTLAPGTPAPDTGAPGTPSPTARVTATTVRSSATTAKATVTTARAATTTSRAASLTPTVAAAAVQSQANSIAQQFAGALASGDWKRVRTLSPASKETDAQFQAQYGNLDDSTVVPVKSTARSATTYALRVGLVAHETNNGVKQTSLYCAHWDVDAAAGTVTRVDGTKLRSESGTKSVATYTAELTKTCATVALD